MPVKFGVFNSFVLISDRRSREKEKICESKECIKTGKDNNLLFLIDELFEYIIK